MYIRLIDSTPRENECLFRLNDQQKVYNEIYEIYCKQKKTVDSVFKQDKYQYWRSIDSSSRQNGSMYGQEVPAL